MSKEITRQELIDAIEGWRLAAQEGRHWGDPAILFANRFAEIIYSLLCRLK